MNIVGIGVDMVEVPRIARMLREHGDRFVQRVFTPGEIAYCSTMHEPAPFYAARFAAKEAVSKALGSGIGEQCGWHDIDVRRKATGEPFIVLHGEGAKLASHLGIERVLLSMSHTIEHAIAQAIAVGSIRVE